MNRATLASILCLAVMSGCAAKGTTTSSMNTTPDSGKRTMKTGYDNAQQVEFNTKDSNRSAQANQTNNGSSSQWTQSDTQSTQTHPEPLPPTLAAKTAPEAVSNFGSTDPSTELQWTYHDAPNPPFQGTPDYAMTEIAFTQGSSTMDNEAAGALRVGMQDLTAGGDREEASEAKLLVVGFADGITERANADALGMRRAEAARDHLVSLGFRRENIQVASYGARYSVAKDWETMKQQYERNAVVWVLK